jgi:RHS repeat-associated protein
VNWFTGFVHDVTHPGQLISDGEHLLGQVADEGAHAVGRGLTDIGLGQVGNIVDGWGDEAASALDPELQLGQTDDPTQLIHGDPAAIRSTAASLYQFSGAFAQTSSGLSGIDTSHWTGAAADAFRAKYAPEPGKWRTASDASSDTGGALESYADTVQWAQGQAREAISLYAQGQKATQAAVTAYNNQVNAYNAAAQAYDAKLSAGQNPGTRPVEPGAFSDPGASLREQAQQTLSAARSQRDQAGAAAEATVSRATGTAPASPGLWSQVGDTLSDAQQFNNLAGDSFLAGAINGVANIGKFARDINPQDPWNEAHPNEYLAGLSGIGAGLVHDAVHPNDLAGQLLGSGWGSDPFEALGNLAPQALLTLATDGAGAAGDAAADGAAAAGDAAAGDTAGDAANGLDGSAGDNPDGAAQPEDAQQPVNDPVDAVTGKVVLYQVDAEFPGVLPLVMRRAHRSGYRAGRLFGRRWASTLDQRLEVSPRGVFAGDDEGVILSYPHPGPDREPAFPVAGARWPLRRDGDAYTVTDPQAGIVRRFEPRSGFYLSAEGYGELPLVSVTDRAGHQIRFDYTLDGAPQAITHDGYQVKVVMAGDRIAGLVLADVGQQGQYLPLVAYRYDRTGNLTEVFNSSGQPLRYSYDDEGRLNGWEDRNGFSYRHYYDEQGRCVRGEGPGGALAGTLSYDPDNLVTTHTDAEGAVTVYQITPQCRLGAITDPLGNTTSNDYDAWGRLVARTDPLGRTTRWTYDSDGNLTAITRPDGSQTTAVYDDHNLPVVITEPGGATWRQDYDHQGHLLWQQAPDGAVTRYSYDQRGYLAAVTDPVGGITRLECDAAGLPVVVTGPDGAVTRYERDKLGRITAITGPDAAVTRLAWTLEGRLAGRMLPDGTAERFSYDGEGNLTGHLHPAAGLTRFEYGAFDVVTARTDPDGTVTDFGYDHLLRQVNVTIAGPGGSPSPRRLTWSYTYDRAGRLVAETDYNGAVSRYVHDAAGQPTRKVNAAGQQISYAYDLLGNLTERSLEGSVARLRYDPAGRVVQAVSPDALLEIERDEMGRVTAETCNGNTVVSSYDAVGRQVRRITPSGAQTRWTYNAAGRPATLEAAGRELRFGYDQAGRETARALPGGAHLAQDWNTVGRLAAQVLTAEPGSGRPGPPAPEPASGAGGLAAGTPQRVPGQAVRRVLQRRGYQYRADGALMVLDDLLSGPRRLTVDPAGRVTSLAGPDWAERYTYDPAGNITAAAWPAPPGPAAAWAGAGAQGPRQYQGTLITGAGDIRYQHDACGRITLRQRTRDSRKPDTWHYQWDADDHLTAVTTPDGTTWRYLYDPLGRRIAKQRLTTDGQVAERTSFIWNGSVLAEQATAVFDKPAIVSGTADGVITTWDYQPGTFVPVTQVTKPGPASWGRASQDEVDSQFYAIVTDLIGAPAELIARDGNLAGYQQRTLWGTTMWHPDGASTPLRFLGQYADDETGLHYNYHRYYDPVTGRYLTPDPLGLLPAPNPHTYVHNPCVIADPLGLAPYTSPDPHVADAANAIDNAMPGRVVGINNQVPMTNGLQREVDVDLGNMYVQVKSGNARGLIGQIQRTEATTGVRTIGYAPNMPEAAWESAARAGIPIARNLQELTAMVKELSP